MSRSFLAAIRNAVVSAPEAISAEADEAGAIAPNANAHSGHTQESAMSDDPNKPGAQASGIPQATHDAAVATARQEGEAAGSKAVNDKFSAIVSAEGIKGNASRMGAAIDLAIKSPGMSAEDVTAFVTANVAAEAPKAAAPAASSASLANRIAADPLAVVGQADPAKAEAGWGKAVAQANTRFGKDAA